MTKGKFYEKMKESFWKEFNESGERWFDYLGPHEENAETTKLIWKDMGIEKILNEAKKEFNEAWEKCRYMIDVVEPMDECLKKWFGDDE